MKTFMTLYQKMVANDDYATAVRKLCEYFKPQCQVNTEYEAFKFHKCEQMADETIDAYCTRLRELAASCKFMTRTENKNPDSYKV